MAQSIPAVQLICETMAPSLRFSLLSMHLLTEAAVRLTPKIERLGVAKRAFSLVGVFLTYRSQIVRIALIGVAFAFVGLVRDNLVVGFWLASIVSPPRPATGGTLLHCTDQSSEQSGQM